ncbi:UNKNOWN [Stylonychia lemnae]|uniref:Transmembrane protein n=1 Tax=Stylonychia lemnae TaxID=5949 RepID=A0A077ZWH2_STYLE|nr:UNKNOWN [Stylonychia lemnae]|eukprot:CDW74295.1 UNKNOWN [Stylonychia lemnae]
MLKSYDQDIYGISDKDNSVIVLCPSIDKFVESHSTHLNLIDYKDQNKINTGLCKVDNIVQNQVQIIDFELPQCVRDIQEKYQLKCTLDAGRAVSFTQLQQNKLNFNPKSSDEGVYEINLRYTNTSGKVVAFFTFSFKFLISKDFEANEKSNMCIDSGKCTVKIKSIFIYQNTQNLGIDMHGKLKIQFSQKILNQDSSNFTEIQNSLKISLIQDYKTKAQIANYEIQSFDKDCLNIQLKFDYSEQISTFDNDFINEKFQHVVKKNQIIEAIIPVQTSNSSKFCYFMNIIALMANFQKSFQLFGSAMSAGVYINMLLQVFLGFAMKRIWTLVNTLQIITHLPLLSLMIPSNLMICLQSVIDISNLNLFPPELANLILGQVSDSVSNTKSSFSEMDIFKYIFQPTYLLLLTLKRYQYDKLVRTLIISSILAGMIMFMIGLTIVLLKYLKNRQNKYIHFQD